MSATIKCTLVFELVQAESSDRFQSHCSLGTKSSDHFSFELNLFTLIFWKAPRTLLAVECFLRFRIESSTSYSPNGFRSTAGGLLLENGLSRSAVSFPEENGFSRSTASLPAEKGLRRSAASLPEANGLTLEVT